MSGRPYPPAHSGGRYPHRSGPYEPPRSVEDGRRRHGDGYPFPDDRPRRRSPSYGPHDPDPRYSGPPPPPLAPGYGGSNGFSDNPRYARGPLPIDDAHRRPLKRPHSPPRYRGRSPLPPPLPPLSGHDYRYARSRSPPPKRFRSPSPYRGAGFAPSPLPLPPPRFLDGPPYPPRSPPGRRPLLPPSPPPDFYRGGPPLSPPPRLYGRLPPPPMGRARSRSIERPPPPGYRNGFDTPDRYRPRSPDGRRRPYRSPSPSMAPRFVGEPPYRARGADRNGDRYEPARGRGRSRSISPVRNGRSEAKSRQTSRPPGKRDPRPLTDPDQLENLVRFEAWSQWFRQANPEVAKEEETNHPNAKPEDQPVVGLPKLYLKYKEAFKNRQLWSLYLVHKDQGWFKDRYSNLSEYKQVRLENTKRGKLPTVETYLKELASGVWDDINYEASHALETQKLPNGISVWGPGQPQASDPDVIEIAHPENQLFIKTVHSNQTRSALEATFKNVPGYQYLALSDPSPKKQYARVGWIQFAASTDMEHALKVLNKVTIGGFQLNMVRNTEPFIGRARYTPSLSCTLDRMKHDCDQAKQMAIRLENDLFVTLPTTTDEDGKSDHESGEKPVTNGTADHHDRQPSERGSTIIAARIAEKLKTRGLNRATEELSHDQMQEKVRFELDQWLSYLRNALHTCYYCVAPTDYAEELYRKCIRHLRSPMVSETTSTTDGSQQHPPDGPVVSAAKPAKRKAHDRNTKADVWTEKRWSDNVDHKIQLVILPRESINFAEYGAKNKEDYPPYTKLIESHISVDDPKKSRCTLCNKPFKASEFVFRHIVSRHPELTSELTDQEEFDHRVNQDYPTFNNLALDPQHLPPTMIYPGSVNQQMPVLTSEMVPTNRDPPVGRRSGDSYHPAGGGGYGKLGPPTSSSSARPSLRDRLGGFSHPSENGRRRSISPPPLSSSKAEDPRARRGKISYVDVDGVEPAADGKKRADAVGAEGLPW